MAPFLLAQSAVALLLSMGSMCRPSPVASRLGPAHMCSATAINATAVSAAEENDAPPAAAAKRQLGRGAIAATHGWAHEHDSKRRFGSRATNDKEPLHTHLAFKADMATSSSTSNRDRILAAQRRSGGSDRVASSTSSTANRDRILAGTRGGGAAAATHGWAHEHDSKRRFGSRGAYDNEPLHAHLAMDSATLKLSNTTSSEDAKKAHPSPDVISATHAWATEHDSKRRFGLRDPADAEPIHTHLAIDAASAAPASSQSRVRKRTGDRETHVTHAWATEHDSKRRFGSRDSADAEPLHTHLAMDAASAQPTSSQSRERKRTSDRETHAWATEPDDSKRRFGSRDAADTEPLHAHLAMGGPRPSNAALSPAAAGGESAAASVPSDAVKSAKAAAEKAQQAASDAMKAVAEARRAAEEAAEAQAAAEEEARVASESAAKALARVEEAAARLATEAAA